MGRYFGTDGIRGKANVYPMSPDFVLKLGQAIGLHFKKSAHRPRILIGKDTRRSGYMLEQALCAGICSVGVDVNFSWASSHSRYRISNTWSSCCCWNSYFSIS